MSVDTCTWVERADGTDLARRINYSMKAAIVLAFVVAIAVPLDHLDGKAMPMRAPLFVGSALVVSLVQRFRRRKFDPYPHTADALVVAPFLLDTLGNLLGIYDSFNATDDVLHLVNWVLLVSAFGAFRFRRIDRTDDAVLLGYGFGALAIIWWEVMEWVVAETGAGGGLDLEYGDTIGDLFLSSTGGLVGALIGRYVMARPVRAVPDSAAAPTRSERRPQGRSDDAGLHSTSTPSA